ncbi:hypothetical protein GCM10010399_52000 [Dactylosporangium fulvum]|uniref:BMP family ABC transporter substrate-binding protein n=1 Tax=Dactylosporangium fulvum TaxID=53359 RepID=A0ABY5VZP7_9ACTN|nr:hypothetical protein [Dactylosporangium fulvum]UWP81251.1 hypothetical protein Dfulv_40025 [Dactylosporangium fulvum]
MRPPLRAVAALATAAALLAGCGSGDDWSGPHPAPSAVGALGPGFVDPSASPTPEATITPRPGSWNGVHPSKGYRVVLLTAGDDDPTKALVTAVKDWADAEDVALKTVVAADAHDLVPAVTRALELHPDLIVSAGNDLVDPLAVVTASHLSQQFLVVGAELAEPTHNVTAVDWSGASFRGEGLGMSSTYDPGSFTAERCSAAVRAGVAAVLNNLTGIVIWLDQF